MEELLSRLFEVRSECFIDVGANVGQTLLKVRALSSDVPYIGFEPNSACVFYLSRLATLNGFKKTAIIPVGLFNRDCLLELDFYTESMVDSAASTTQHFRPNQAVYRKEFVPVFRFDGCKTIPFDEIGVIKVDVEGGELEVLEGMQETISVFRPFIIVEVLPVYSEANLARLKRQEKLEALIARDL